MLIDLKKVLFISDKQSHFNLPSASFIEVTQKPSFFVLNHISPHLWVNNPEKVLINYLLQKGMANIKLTFLIVPTFTRVMPFF
jgi:hypothetical protein